MESLSFAHRADQESATLFDGAVGDRAEGRLRRPASNPPQAYQAENLLDGLSVYAGMFGCATGCQSAHA